MKMTSITRIALILVLAGSVPMLRAPAAWAQTATLSGVVTDKAAGESLLGVNVVVAGTALGTTTDLHGNYRLDRPSGTQTLVFSYIVPDRKPFALSMTIPDPGSQRDC